MGQQRPVRVYQLDVTYPPGAHTPGWHPPGWTPARPGERFTWPRVELCLSHVTAHRRAALLESYGAYVTVHASHPVTWPLDPRDAAENLALADQVAVLRAALEEAERAAAQAHVVADGERARAARYAAQLGVPTYGPPPTREATP